MAESREVVEKFPVPLSAPTYDHPPGKVSGRRWPVYAVVSSVFVGLALVFAFWLAALLLLGGLSSGWLGVVYLVAFWGLLAYLAMPRLNQIFTLIYVPDYFIGRTRTGDGVLGDPVNLAVDGTEADLHAAMVRAGWTRADEITAASTWRIIVSAVFGRSYPQAPVSDLFLFDRRQEFAYQQEVDGDAAQRHHVRFWPVPYDWVLPGGERVQWLASATYDRAVGLALFTGQVTHKIDADIDVERDYLVNTVRYADPMCGVRVIEDFSTAYHARNGGGDSVRTDGDLPVLDVAGAAERADGPVIAEPQASGRHHLPPPALLFTGMVISLQVLAALAGLSVDLRLGVVRTVVALVVAGIWLLTVARRRWAWVSLMALSTLSALDPLIRLTGSGQVRLLHVVTASLAVLLVLAVSARSVRAWVHGDRPESHAGQR